MSVPSLLELAARRLVETVAPKNLEEEYKLLWSLSYDRSKHLSGLELPPDIHENPLLQAAAEVLRHTPRVKDAREYHRQLTHDLIAAMYTRNSDTATYICSKYARSEDVGRWCSVFEALKNEVAPSGRSSQCNKLFYPENASDLRLCCTLAYQTVPTNKSEENANRRITECSSPPEERENYHRDAVMT